jgi:heat shock protein HslJ
MRASLLLAPLLAGSVLFSACGSDDKVSGGSSGLEGVPWQLDASSTLGVPLGQSSVTALFAGGTLSGFAGCNNYTTSYTVDGSKLTIAAPMAATQKACDPAVMAVEQAYLAALAKTAVYKVDGKTLTLADDTGAKTLVYGEVTADALNGSWTATSYRTATAITSTLAGTTVTLVIDGDAVSGSGGCNTYNGPVKVDGTSITIGPLATTRKACEQPIMDQETAYLTAIQQATTYKITGDRLDLLMSDGTFAATFVKG